MKVWIIEHREPWEDAFSIHKVVDTKEKANEIVEGLKAKGVEHYNFEVTEFDVE